jgi:23S rRNA pseudouridine2605 synthase
VSEKLQKVLARAGLGSRRQLEQWIVEGRIKVNGKLAKLGDRVDEFAEIRVDNFPLQKHVLQEKKTRVILYHKPEGEVTTRSDPEGRPTVFDHLPLVRNARWIAIGRLDLNTSGVLLFTTDGQLANHLMHPSSEIEREYAVRIYGEVTDLMLKNLKKGVKLEDGIAKFLDVKFVGGEGKNRWYHVIICEGRNREVRRLWESQEGIKVSRLIRVRFGNISLPPMLRPGKWMELELDEIEKLSMNKNRTASDSQRAKPFSKNSRPVLKRNVSKHTRPLKKGQLA